MRRVLIALLVLGCLLFVFAALGLGLVAWLAPPGWQEGVVISIDGHRLTLPDWHWGHGLAGALGISIALLLALVLVPVAVLLGLLAALLGLALGIVGVVIALAVGLSPLLLLGLVVWLIVRDRRPPQVPPAPPGSST
jgi:hypothetical protein